MSLKKSSLPLTIATCTIALASIANADSIKPMGSIIGGNGVVFPEGKKRFVAKYVSMDKSYAYNGSEKAKDTKNRKQEVNNINYTLRYGLGNNFDIRGILPYVSKKLTMNHPVNKKVYQSSNKGLGDMKIIGKYQLLSQKRKDPIFLSVGLGLKLPTGSTNKTFDTIKGEERTPTMQLGSGSVDYITEVGITKFMKNSRIDAHTMYTFTNEGNHDFEFGDKLKWNLAYSYALNSNIDLELSLNGCKTEKNKQNGKEIDSSGFTVTYLAPSIHYRPNKIFDVSVTYSSVIDRDVNYDTATSTGGLGEDGKTIIRVGYNF
jgi:hypothetical protein